MPINVTPSSFAGNRRLRSASTRNRDVDRALPAFGGSRSPHVPEILAGSAGLRPRDVLGLPNFLVVSPPKTGTSWLAEKLLRHPQIAMAGQKETHFFTCFHQWCDVEWYNGCFAKPGTALRGEATPTYSILPPCVIERLAALVPHLKLIFLLREPVGRAWSHARHNWLTGEANFSEHGPAIPVVDDGLWRQNFEHRWPLASGDYLGQLRRWMAFFPRDQIYVGFFETIATQPRRLLNDMMSFLELEVPFPEHPALSARLNPGPKVDSSPALLAALEEIYRDRTLELVDFLARQFGMRVPFEWDRTVGSTVRRRARLESPMKEHAEREFDDAFLSEIVRLEAGYLHVDDPQVVRHLGEPYHGYHICLNRRRVYAIAQQLDPLRLPQWSSLEWAEYEHAGLCLVADHVRPLREKIAAAIEQRASRTNAA